MKNIKNLSDEELKNILLTYDGKGKDAKEKALQELLDRAENEGYDRAKTVYLIG